MQSPQTAVKERPILFNGEMVRAILEGRKTQTRRVLKEHVSYQGGSGDNADFSSKAWNCGCVSKKSLREAVISDRYQGFQDGKPVNFKCPYGQPGDRLWVRETCIPFEHGHVSYRADHASDPKGDKAHGVVWTPSIHMPRWASRILLEIVSVRVERVQSISISDAICEGIKPFFEADLTSVDVFSERWDEVYGEDSWDANPWVWVVEFKRVQPA